MATLISQNVVPKAKTENPKRKALDDPSPLEPVQEPDNLKGSESPKPKKKKKERKENKESVTEQELEMKKLENTLFGSLHPVKFGNDSEEVDQENDDSTLFFTDRSANSELSVYEEDIKGEIVGTDVERKPVWVDEEEQKVNINIAKVNRLRKMRKEEHESVISGSEYVTRLRAQHMKLNPTTDWARLDSQAKNATSDSDSDQDDGDIDTIFQTSEDLVVKGKSKLQPGLLEYARLVDANRQDPSNGPINSVQFHRNGQLLLTGGLDKKLRFFQIDGKRNTKIQSIFVEDCPIRKASFTPDGSQVILSGRRKFFYSFDLVNAKTDKIGPLVGRDEKSLESFEISPDSKTIAFLGNEGYILLVSTKTKELIGTLKMNGTSRALTFVNGQQLLTTGGDGQIYHWDLRTMSCFHKGVDEGCITGTALSTTPTENLFAAGSDSGIVNVYNRDEFLGGKKRPLKVIENLTTKIDFLKFNHDAQILAVCSGMKKNGMKLVHVPSLTVFSNWPPLNRTLQYPRCLDFSPGGGLMAMGNASGRVLLYKLNHYQHA